MAGALLNKPDSDQAVTLIESVEKRRGASADTLQSLERKIAELIDNGETYPVGEQKAFQGVLWIAQTNPNYLPQEMPRDFALYLAMGWKTRGRFTTVTEGLEYIFDNFTFS